MSKELATINHIPAPTNLDELQRMTKMMIASGYFKNVKDLAQGCVKVMAGQELGISPVASLQGIHFVNDRLCYEAVILGSALRRRGYRYTAISQGDKGASIEFSAPDGTCIGVSEFTEEHARTAGLLGKDVYKKYPRNMYWARAMANGCRWFCPDVFGGPVYVPEELGADVDDSGKPISAEVVDQAKTTKQSDAAKALTDRLRGQVPLSEDEIPEFANGGTHPTVSDDGPNLELEG